jgi:hypothetical protein
MNSDINFNKITTDLQQNNNWNAMTIENVLSNNKQHPVKLLFHLSMEKCGFFSSPRYFS